MNNVIHSALLRDFELNSIFRLVNESLQMLTRYPELNTKILPLMEDYLVALRYEHKMSCSERSPILRVESTQ